MTSTTSSTVIVQPLSLGETDQGWTVTQTTGFNCTLASQTTGDGHGNVIGMNGTNIVLQLPPGTDGVWELVQNGAVFQIINTTTGDAIAVNTISGDLFIATPDTTQLDQQWTFPVFP